MARRLRHLLAQVECTGKQVHDANVVATMLEHDVREFVTLNAPDFERFAAFITVRDLSASPPP